jgi:hypothetical protein
MSEELSAQAATVPAPPDASMARPDGPVNEAKEADVALPTDNGVNDAAATTRVTGMCYAC